MFSGIAKYGIKRWSIGVVKYFRNIILLKRYGFSKWHITPIEFRDYAVDVVRFSRFLRHKGIISDNSFIVEIGCGLGEMLNGINHTNSIGIDISKSVISCASQLYTNIDFCTGSFDCIKGYNIGMLMLINFIHEIDQQTLKSEINKIVSSNDVNIIVMDVLENIEMSNYKFSHNGNEMVLPMGFKLIYKSKDYIAEGEAIRHIEYWKKVNDLKA